jgi:nitrogen fixation protein FixH
MRDSDGAGPWPVALALLLAAGLSAPLAFLWIATHQTEDRLSVDPWTAGVAYNASLDARERARAHGWDVELRAERRASGVHVELVPKSDRDPLPAAPEVTLRRERPERSDLDADVPVDRSRRGYGADVALPLPGRWTLVARVGDDSAFVERRFALDVGE